MRKISKYKKQFIIRQSLRKFRYELRCKEERFKWRCQNNSKTIQQNRAKNFIKNPEKAKKEVFKAPAIFSLLDDPITVISFFEKARKVLAQGMPIFFDLSGILQMGPETLAYSCALFKDNSFTKNTPIRGNVPDDKNLKKMFEKIGFWDHFQSDTPRSNQMEDISGKLIHRVIRKRVESKLAANVVESAVKHTFEIENFIIKSQNSYIILIECMGNTWEHSNYGEADEAYNWWMLAYKEPSTKITKFCFLDLGVGIFGSLRTKYNDKSLVKKLINVFIPKSNKMTLEKIFEGEKTTSSTLPGRGLGLNNIYKRAKSDSNIRNLTILSNDIMARIGYNTSQITKNDSIQKLNSNFGGTLYYWELVPNHE